MHIIQKKRLLRIQQKRLPQDMPSPGISQMKAADFAFVRVVSIWSLMNY